MNQPLPVSGTGPGLDVVSELPTVTATATGTVTWTPTITPTPTATPATAERRAALQCQQAIERGGTRYALEMLRAIDTCARTGSGPLAACLAAATTDRRLEQRRRAWRKRATHACMGVALRRDLAYFETCAAPPSTCTFASAVVDAAGPQNDLIDCLACRTEEQLQAVGSLLFAEQSIHHACQETIGQQGTAILRRLIEQLRSCLNRRGSESIAVCLSKPADATRVRDLVTEWRTSSEATCAGLDPFAELGYASLCGGVEPVRPAACSFASPSCAFESVGLLSAPGTDDDLLDCLQCQVEDAALGVIRTLYGAELCCTAEGCRAVRSRAACRRAGGGLAYYQLDSVDVGSVGSPHGIAVTADGSIYLGDTGNARVVVRGPDGSVGVVGLTSDLPFGVAVDPSGNVYVGLRNNDRVVRLAPDGFRSAFAGTGEPLHSGDNVPAVTAAVAAPNGVAADAQGNVYITESGIFRLFFGGVGTATDEYIRVVDPAGIIHTVAGAGPYSLDGAGVGGPALSAGLASPYQVATVPDGSLLIGEVGLQRVLRLETNGILTHVAGRPLLSFNGVGAYSGDGGPALAARLYSAEGVGQDADGNIFIADMRNSRVRMVDPDGSIITVAGTGEGYLLGTAPDGSPGALVKAGCPGALAVGPDGRVYYPDLPSSLIRVLTRVSY